jgi:hypothetical protein
MSADAAANLMQDRLAAAIACIAPGNLAEAERPIAISSRRIPGNADALHLLGALKQQRATGRVDRFCAPGHRP